MKLLDLLIETRRDLLTILCGAEGATRSQLGGDRTIANFETRLQLQALLRKHLQHAEEFGIHLVTRHDACGRRDHTDDIISHPRNKVAVYGNEAFRWTDVRFSQGERNSICPCASGATASKHHVIDELVVRKLGAS